MDSQLDSGTLDVDRGTWTATHNFKVGWTAQSEWYNYTRTIPANSYKGQDREVKTVAVTNILIVRNDLPDDLVYELLKAMYDDAPRLAAAHAAMKAFKLEDGLKGITGVVELHPGAARFFKSKGMSN